MTSIIKASDEASHIAVRGVSYRAENIKPHDSEGDASEFQTRIDALLHELEIMTSERDRAREEAVKAYQTGEEDGRKAGLREADERVSEQFRLLEAGIKAAQDCFERELAQLEKLAFLVARNCLDQIFGDPEREAELLSGIIQHQLGKLAGEERIQVAIPAETMKAVETLLRVERPGGYPGIELVGDETLSAGDCRITLKMGVLSAGIGQQWGRLRSALTDFAESGGTGQ